jgi:hypothetical protein
LRNKTFVPTLSTAIIPREPFASAIVAFLPFVHDKFSAVLSENPMPATGQKEMATNGKNYLRAEGRLAPLWRPPVTTPAGFPFAE